MKTENPLPVPPAVFTNKHGFSVSENERLQALTVIYDALTQIAQKLDSLGNRAKGVFEKELSHHLIEQSHSIKGGALSLKNYVSRIKRPRSGWTVGNPKPAILGGENNGPIAPKSAVEMANRLKGGAS
jgi:hypothetical protein